MIDSIPVLTILNDTMSDNWSWVSITSHGMYDWNTKVFIADESGVLPLEWEGADNTGGID